MKIAVLGTGTVGVMTVCHFLYYFKEAQIDCIYNPDKNILGIGESTNWQTPSILWKAAHFNAYRDCKELDSTIKYGVLYKNWREKDFWSPILPPVYAMHFNNFKLAEVIFKKLKLMYRGRFNTIEADIKNVDQNKDSVVVQVPNDLFYDYVIDCRGYPENYDDYTTSKFLPLNHALVHSIPKPGDWNYTFHQATEHGWMFGIPLKTRQGWGYLFNDEITSIDEAKKDIAKIFNKSVDSLQLREFKFKPYSANKFLDKRIIKNGSRAIFYEPLEALSGVFYDNINRNFTDYIREKKTEREVNKDLVLEAQRYENFICYAYHGGSNFNTKFWQYAKKITKDHLDRSALFKQTTTITHIIDENFVAKESFPFSPLSWRLLDKGFNYNYFK